MLKYILPYLAYHELTSVREGGSFPPFQMTGMEKTTRKKLQKIKVGHFGE